MDSTAAHDETDILPEGDYFISTTLPERGSEDTFFFKESLCVHRRKLYRRVSLAVLDVTPRLSMEHVLHETPSPHLMTKSVWNKRRGHI